MSQDISGNFLSSKSQKFIRFDRYFPKKYFASHSQRIFLNTFVQFDKISFDLQETLPQALLKLIFRFMEIQASSPTTSVKTPKLKIFSTSSRALQNKKTYKAIVAVTANVFVIKIVDIFDIIVILHFLAHSSAIFVPVIGFRAHRDARYRWIWTSRAGPMSPLF